MSCKYITFQRLYGAQIGEYVQGNNMTNRRKRERERERVRQRYLNLIKGIG